jgi:WD40 repeat protein
VQGSPYPGLEPYDRDRRAVFFGRELAICDACDELVAKAAAAPGMPALFVIGPSGSGKSSLARAGIALKLTDPGTVKGVDLWRSITVEVDAGTLATLAGRLYAEGGLPELEYSPQQDPSAWARLAAASPSDAADAVVWALHRVAAAEQRRIGADRAIQTRLLLVIDQLERAFGTDEISNLAAILRAFAETGRVWLIATLRSDRYAALQGDPDLLELKRRGVVYDLPAPGPAEIADIVKGPARAAALTFEPSEEDGRSLPRTLVENTPSADALPLLQMTLRRLFDARGGMVLTWKAYDAMGGVAGAIASHADAMLRAASPVARIALPGLIGELTRDVGRDPGGRVRFTTKAADTDWGKTAARRELLDHMVAARLLVRDEPERARTVFRVAHEALLRQWIPASSALERIADRALRRAKLRQLMALALIVVLSAALGAAFYEWRESQKRSVLALVQSARANMLADQQLESLIDSLQAERLSQNVFFGNEEIKSQVVGSLISSFNNIQENNRWRVANGDWREGVLPNTTLWKDTGKLMFTTADKGRVNLWDASGKLTATIDTQQGLLSSIAFSPERQELVTGGYNGTIKRWDTSGKLIETLPQEKDGFASVGYSPDGRWLATSIGADSPVKLWNAHGASVVTINPAQEVVFDIAFSPDGRRLATAGFDHTAKIWSVTGGWPLATINTGQGRLSKIAFSADGQSLGTYSRDDSTTKLWSLRSKASTIVTGPDIPEMAFGPDGFRSATLGEIKGTADLWNFTGTRIATIGTQQNDWPCLTFSQDGQLIAIAGQDGVVTIWNATGKLLNTLNLKKGKYCPAVAFGPNGPWFATVADDSTVGLWDAKGNHIAALDTQNKDIRRVILHTNGQLLATFGGGGRLSLWEAKGNLVASQILPQQDGYRLAFSLDGQRVATGGSDGTVQLWDVKSGAVTTIYTRQGIIDDIKYSADGGLLATCSQLTDKVDLWNTVGDLIATTSTLSHGVCSVAFSPDGKSLATGRNMTVKLWQIGDERDLVHRICDEWWDFLHNPKAVLGERDRHLCDGIGPKN